MTGKTIQAYSLIRKENESFEDVRIEIFMEAIHLARAPFEIYDQRLSPITMNSFADC